MNTHLSLEQTKELVALCRIGKLYEIERRVTQWGTLCPHPETHCRTPLYVAIEKGFHSLVELLIRHTPDQSTKNKALLQAVYKNRADLTEVLVEHGADPLSVTFEDILRSYSRDMMRYFIAKGADLITGYPFAYTFQCKVRPALGVYLDCRRNFPQWATELQQQLDMALCYHCGTGSLRWVCLLRWAGGNPLVNVPNIRKREYVDDPDMRTTGVEEAAMHGHLDVIKKLGAITGEPVWQKALYSACSFGESQVVRFILEAGVSPNDKPNGGSSALEAALRHLGWGASLAPHYPYASSTASNAMESVSLLIQHGARLAPDDRSAINVIRRSLYQENEHYTLDLVKLLVKHKACDAGFLRRFCSTPKMLSNLGGKIDAEELLSRLS